MTTLLNTKTNFKSFQQNAKKNKQNNSLNNFHNSQNKNLSSAWLSNKQSKTSGSALKDISISDKKIMDKIIQSAIHILLYT